MSIPPADLFQLPWEQGDAWVSLDGIDNGFKRGPRSPHLYSNGGAVDFAPRKDMVQGEDTSNYWVTAAAAGTVIQISSCHLIISHPGGWNTEYQFLANIQVSMGEAVYRNQNLGIIASGTASQPFCSPVTHDIPHLHFSIRPNMEMVSFAGWEVNYNSLFNQTTFTKNGQKAYQYDPLLNIPALQINNLGDITWDITYTGSLDQYRYEKWHFVLTDLTSFSITTTPATDGLLPMIILFDANGNEITRGTEFLTSTQPAGDYFIQIQPEEGQGFYNLLLEEMTEDDK
ncbi:MAG: M23 family metallopeptidase, partial [Anaerolineae bacterium]|nr:M23 family metallopeptidase [Anaerolineae bacterium]